MPKRLVIWDVDGTLIDSQVEIVAAMTASFRAEGLEPPTAAQTLSIVGLSLPVAIAQLRPGLTPAEVETLTEGYKAAFMAHRAAHGVSGSPLFPGIRAVLDQLRADPETVMAVATGKSMRGLEAIIAGHGLEGYFASLQVSDNHPSKPHPAMILAALAETGGDPARTVMIGDTSFDMDMAQAAGVRGLAVDWGYHPSDRLGGDALAKSPADLIGLIARLTENADG